MSNCGEDDEFFCICCGSSSTACVPGSIGGTLRSIPEPTWQEASASKVTTIKAQLAAEKAKFKELGHKAKSKIKKRLFGKHR